MKRTRLLKPNETESIEQTEPAIHVVVQVIKIGPQYGMLWQIGSVEPDGYILYRINEEGTKQFTEVKSGDVMVVGKEKVAARKCVPESHTQTQQKGIQIDEDL